MQAAALPFSSPGAAGSASPRGLGGPRASFAPHEHLCEPRVPLSWHRRVLPALPRCSPHRVLPATTLHLGPLLCPKGHCGHLLPPQTRLWLPPTSPGTGTGSWRCPGTRGDQRQTGLAPMAQPRASPRCRLGVGSRPGWSTGRVSTTRPPGQSTGLCFHHETPPAGARGCVVTTRRGLRIDPRASFIGSTTFASRRLPSRPVRAARRPAPRSPFISCQQENKEIINRKLVRGGGPGEGAATGGAAPGPGRGGRRGGGCRRRTSDRPTAAGAMHIAGLGATGWGGG